MFKTPRKKIFKKFSKKTCIFQRNGVYYLLLYRGVAQFGRVPEWGSGGRWFESSHSDHIRASDESLALFFCKQYPYTYVNNGVFFSINIDTLYSFLYNVST